MNICVYDFDNTLAKGNTLYCFVKYVTILSEKNLLLKTFKYFRYYIYIFVISKFSSKSKTEFLVSQLRGYSKELLKRYGIEYVKYHLFFNNSVVSCLKKDITNGFVPYIISGNILEIIEPAAFQLNIKNIYTSKLEYDNDICTGYFDKDIRGRKLQVVNEMILEDQSINLESSKFVSDNVEDIPAAKKFKFIVGVIINQFTAKNWYKVTDSILILNSGIRLTSIHIYLLAYYFITVRTNWLTLLFHRLSFLALVLFLYGGLSDVGLLFASWFVFVASYEVGYIDNDYYAVKKEINPTIRLAADQAVTHIFYFISARIFYLLAITYISMTVWAEFYYVTIASLLNLIIYIFHNRLPRKNRLITYSILKSSHLYIPLLFFVQIYAIIIAITFFYLPHVLCSYSKKVGLINKSYIKLLYAMSLVQTLGIICVFRFNIIDYRFFFVSLFLYLISLSSLFVHLIKWFRDREKPNLFKS